MIRRTRVFLSVLIVVVVVVSLGMANFISVQAAPDLTHTRTSASVSALSSGTYFVSINGKDTNPGTLAAPWRHIQYAMDRVGPGGTINVLTGVYKEFVTFKN